MMVARKNPYLEMPLPVNVAIDFDLFARNGLPKGRTWAMPETEAVREVVHALNAWAYGQDRG